MDCDYRVCLDAFQDGELEEAAAREVERHLESCPACAEEMAEIREVSRSFGPMARDMMSRAALARAHAAAEAAASELASPLPRVAGLLTGLAASVLVVVSAWLWEAPVVRVQPPQVEVASSAPAAEWERVAMTLDAAPSAGEAPDVTPRPTLADARLADWMLRNLSR
jgi:anti-sigma factor RsiW